MRTSFASRLRGATILSAAVLGAGLIVSTGAHAQSSTTPPGYFFTLGDPLKSFGDQMANYGIYFNAANVNVVYDNVSGGRKTGVSDTNDASAGMDFDMTKLAGIPGARAHIQFDDRAAGFNGNYTGSVWGSSPEYGPVEVFQLSELSWEQSLFDDHLRLYAGRISPLGDFSTFDVYCNFYSIGVCGNGPAGYYFDNSATYAPVSTWGFRATVKPSLSTYIRAGIYADDDAAYYTTHSHGFTDWGLSQASGVFIPFQIGYDSVTQNYPTHVMLGGYYDSSNYSVGATGTPAAIVAGSANAALNNQRGRTSVYMGLEQTVWKPDPKSDRQLIAFGEATWSVEGEAPIENAQVIGLVLQGPFASRPHDTVNFAWDFAKYNHRFAQAAAFGAGYDNGGGIGVMQATPSENWIEFSYSAAVMPGFSIQPFLQYFTNPEMAVSNANIHHDSFTIGVATVVVLNGLLGLPGLGHSN